MSLPPKRVKLVLDKKGVHMGDASFSYPIKLGRLKNYKNAFKDVAVELFRKGNNYYLNFYDRQKGLIAMGRIPKLDAINLLRSRLSKVGYDDRYPMTSEEFTKLVRRIDMSYVDI